MSCLPFPSLPPVFQGRNTLLVGPLLSGILCFCLGSPVVGQSFDGTESAAAASPFAPGVLTVIPVVPIHAETFSGPREFADIVQGISGLEWMPHFTPNTRTLLETAKNVIYRRSIWNLEFAFKPVRMINVNVPQADGTTKRELVWYIVYRVKNEGYHLNPKPEEDQFGNEIFGTNRINHTVRFFPQLVLESHETNQSALDRVIPAALGPIQKKERPPGKLHNSVSISAVDIPLSTDRIGRGLWGVATWTGIDPHTDFFSIFVTGLTNAYRFEENFVEDQSPGTGRTYKLKTIQINFWRAGDSLDPREREIHLGMPGISSPLSEKSLLGMYGMEKRVDHQWIYR